MLSVGRTIDKEAIRNVFEMFSSVRYDEQAEQELLPLLAKLEVKLTIISTPFTSTSAILQAIVPSEFILVEDVADLARHGASGSAGLRADPAVVAFGADARL